MRVKQLALESQKNLLLAGSIVPKGCGASQEENDFPNNISKNKNNPF
ncbi:MAG: hypothetical protein UV82_C0011G0047 [Candidatus Magasanikbacteria bacterium GW2011_GWD2_43_18]|uniref:Uncharacterized protein n=1 Tax=Candidatus Magasanikbacteria bacterium GW2011_GWE2_42_7 TaxID=1619052 RepID=A0A0G1DL21_9BACT|nr:MAG: hypothetical protein UV18_C0007G0050 [Candidatus Magasanikbacteria bacterium GW2011_GWC2_42_27]KKS71531.1 MAG: hypothetical protein UV42_C0025G0010 [Candidatus Magasanikbacteria bacterium GW2011_GWE2_42_7]KKT04119.1 MAG: hypothetical protein UV82_C0011G0047 [Candidatus Magasanikbacteria bacterium GW2011_GWD2_43_18]KKT25702.1 MAG: hypothetical protein UW10_C0005G0069 [Candidatus Magasanikbacteria bacterium GW2011_GWA2_43_9]